MACHTRSGVAGISSLLLPMASVIALMTAADEPIAEVLAAVRDRKVITLQKALDPEGTVRENQFGREVLDFDGQYIAGRGRRFGLRKHQFQLIAGPLHQPRARLVSLGYDPPRQIYTDGRPLPKDPDPLWMGYAAGQWQVDTLVVESAGFNDKTWLDGMGHPRSESAHMTERFHRRDFGHLDVELTVNDPKYYTRAFTVKLPFHLIPDTDVLEAVCAENEKDRVHLAN